MSLPLLPSPTIYSTAESLLLALTIMASSETRKTIDTNLWFDDGNIVLIAETTAFRVHKSILARHSEVFRGLFSIPQPINPDDVEMMDGCFVVRLPDRRYDLRHLLRAIYYGIK